MTAEYCARTFYVHWISRFRAPEIITTDQWKQFESCFLKELRKIIGVKRIWTTSYHPSANGIVEKWHRHLTCLMCVTTSTDMYFTYEMLFGQALRILWDFCNTSIPNIKVGTFMNECQRYLQQTCTCTPQTKENTTTLQTFVLKRS